MNTFFKIAAITGMVCLSNASFASHQHSGRNEGKNIRFYSLNQCHGQVKVSEFENFVRINFRDLKHCNEAKINGRFYSLDRHSHYSNIEIPKDRHHSYANIVVFNPHRRFEDRLQIKLGANFGHDHHSKIHLSRHGEQAELHRCGGTADLRDTKNWYVLRIRNNKYCNSAKISTPFGQNYEAISAWETVKVRKISGREYYAVQLETRGGRAGDTIVIHERTSYQL